MGCTRSESLWDAPDRSRYGMHQIGVIMGCTRSESLWDAPDRSHYGVHQIWVIMGCTRSESLCHAPDRSHYGMHQIWVIMWCTRSESLWDAPDRSHYAMLQIGVIMWCTRSESLWDAPDLSHYGMHQIGVIMWCTRSESLWDAPDLRKYWHSEVNYFLFIHRSWQYVKTGRSCTIACEFNKVSNIMGDQCPSMILESHGSCTCILHPVLILIFHVVGVQRLPSAQHQPQTSVFYDTHRWATFPTEPARIVVFNSQKLQVLLCSNTYLTKFAVLQHRCSAIMQLRWKNVSQNLNV